MKKVLLLVPLVLFVCGVAGANPAGKTAVVYNPEFGWIGKHASEEFAKYTKLLTGEEANVFSEKGAFYQKKPSPSLNSYENIVAIGITNLVADNKDELEKLSKVIGEDGFVIKTQNEPDLKDKNLLVITGVTGQGTLYGVYHYLENLCGVGFFWEEDRIPKIDKLPVENINIVEKPRFERRLVTLGGCYRGLDKFDLNYWGFERWQQSLDWMAKRKLNTTIYHLNTPSTQFFGSAFEDAYPEIGHALEEAVYQANWPAGWDWPAKYRTELTRKVLDYGRQLGIKFVYSFDLSNVPVRFKKVHPELKYIEQDVGYGLIPLYPGDENNLEVMRKYGKKLIEYFGTDHLYASAPLCEAAPGKGLEEQRMLKVKAAKDHINMITSIDPDAIWVTDSWAFYMKDLWTVDFVRDYLKDIPNDRFYIYDTAFELFPEPLYKKHNYFHDKPFAVGVMHAYGSDDNLFGSFERLLDVVKGVASDSKAKNCTGLFGVSELFGENIAYWHMFSKLTWNPDAVSIDWFIDNYTISRYGKSAQPTMKKVWLHLLNSVHSNDLNKFSGGTEQYYRPTNPFYKFSRLGFGNPESYPLCKEWEQFVDKRFGEAVKMSPELGQALELALSTEKSCENNNLYENDLVDIVRTYLGYVSDYHLCLTYKAFKSGNKEKFEKHSKMALDVISAIQKILQTRADFSIVRQLNQVMAVEGTNKYTSEMIRAGCVTAAYPTRDVTEQVRDYYIPLVQHSISVMREKMAVGKNEVALSEISPFQAPKAKQIHEEWIKNDLASGFTGGDTVKAIRDVLSSVGKACVIKVEDSTDASAVLPALRKANINTGSNEWLPTWDKTDSK